MYAQQQLNMPQPPQGSVMYTGVQQQTFPGATTFPGGYQLGATLSNPQQQQSQVGYTGGGTYISPQGAAYGTSPPPVRTINDIVPERPQQSLPATFQQPGQPRPSTQSDSSARKRRQSAAEVAEDQIHSMHIQMVDVEETIAVMQAENEWLKQKLLRDRQTTLTKYFMRDSHLALQAVMHEWKRIMEVLRRMREVDGVESLRAQDRNTYVHRIAELEQQIQYAGECYRASELEKTEYQERLALAERTIFSTSEEVAAFPFGTEEPAPPTVQDKARYMKFQLHKTLSEVDPNYLPAGIQNDAEGMGDLDAIMRAQFLEADRDQDGQLQWNNGEIRHFIRRSLEIANHRHPQWNDWEWYTMYRQFDRDGSHTMNFQECSALTKAVRDAAHGGPPVAHAANIQATVVPQGTVVPQTRVW